MVYRPKYGLSQTHYQKNRSRLTHRKRKKGNWMSFKPRALLLKIGYLRGIKLQCARWKNYLMTNFLGWELFSNGGSTVGTLGQCILQNFLNVVRTNVYIISNKIYYKTYLQFCICFRVSSISFCLHFLNLT